jgi:hypothetical protein
MLVSVQDKPGINGSVTVAEVNVVLPLFVTENP